MWWGSEAGSEAGKQVGKVKQGSEAGKQGGEVKQEVKWGSEAGKWSGDVKQGSEAGKWSWGMKRRCEVGTWSGDVKQGIEVGKWIGVVKQGREACVTCRGQHGSQCCIGKRVHFVQASWCRNSKPGSSEFPGKRTFLQKLWRHTRKIVSTACPLGCVGLEYYWYTIEPFKANPLLYSPIHLK